MQIGNSDLDKVCEKAIVPALKSCGLDPKRVDKHNEGRLLKSEIVGFIKSSDIIIADLTNERPNCYLEVGYAMGLDKFQNLILTAREDHNQGSPNYKKGGSRIHFDLSGYDILFWDPNDLDGFREELQKRIKRRLSTLTSRMKIPVTPWNTEWISKHQKLASYGLTESQKQGYMEIRATLTDLRLNVSQAELLRAADQAQIHTFGWPIGVVLNSGEKRPKPVTDGIFAEIKSTLSDSYDYWAIRSDGTFYLCKSLFEDQKSSGLIFFNTRIVRITETLLYLDRLYSSLKVLSNTHILIAIEHGGLKDRVLAATPNRLMLERRQSKEGEVCTEVETTIDEIRSNLTNIVEKFTQPLFVVFDFFELDKKVLEQIVNDFVAGRVT